MASDAQPWDVSDEDWERMHAPKNSAGCYALGIAELRRRHEAGEPIVSREYGPRECAAARTPCEVA